MFSLYPKGVITCQYINNAVAAIAESLVEANVVVRRKDIRSTTSTAEKASLQPFIRVATGYE